MGKNVEGSLTVHPHKLGIFGGGCQGDAERGSKGVLKQEYGHDKGFHAGGRFGEGVFESGDAGKDLGERDQEVGRGLHGDMDAIGRGFIGCRAR